MKLLTSELRLLLPRIRSTRNEDRNAIIKYFAPWTTWAWYAAEFDGVDMFFGLESTFVVERSHFSLAVLEEARGPGGLRIERDPHFIATPISELETTSKPRHCGLCRTPTCTCPRVSRCVDIVDINDFRRKKLLNQLPTANE